MPPINPSLPRTSEIYLRLCVLSAPVLVASGCGTTQPCSSASAPAAARADSLARFWGTRWIALPDPQYGSWMGALFEYDYGLSPTEQLRCKHDQFDTKTETP